ncbi:MAG TPA: helix-turn-helix domain-containing protein [Acidimicrobiia bacterium]|nr:helix-turn-helix domain-containing protein [Acidimicrobiia bacterium]
MSLYAALLDESYRPARSSRLKLNAKQVAEMRQLYLHCGWTQNQLADHFGVSQGHISKVVRELQWKDIP